MSWVSDGKVKSQSALVWIPEHAPKNGVFRVWWTEDDPAEGVSLVDNGCHLRWQMEFVNGERADGTSYGWFPSGQIRQIITWKNGVMDGPNLQFHGNGYINNQMQYLNGKEHGVWFKRDYDGSIERVQEWDNGKLIWEEDGPHVMDRSIQLAKLKFGSSN